IIIIDDGSNDSSGKIAQSFADKHTNIHLFSQQNKGVSAARNRGLELANGEFVYFLDADDYIASNVLFELINIAKGNKLEILGFRSSSVSDHTHIASTNIGPYNNSVEVMDGISFIGNKGLVKPEVWWYIINKSFLLDTGIRFVEGKIGQDAIFTPNIFLKANRVTKVNLDVHRFVKVENSIQTTTNYKHILKYVDDLVFAIEEIYLEIKQIDPGHKYHKQAVMELRRKQQAMALAVFIKIFRCPSYEISRLNEVLMALNKIGVYPLSRKVGGLGNHKTRFVYNNFILSILSNKTLFYLTLRFNRLIPIITN
ncbi:glycosyltransferase, partial [Olleya sp. AH-315-K02]|nr:glycosyltransferase [Olleya sp. AH-315-K02]